jgi:hypothetical protein
MMSGKFWESREKSEEIFNKLRHDRPYDLSDWVLEDLVKIEFNPERTRQIIINKIIWGELNLWGAVRDAYGLRASDRLDYIETSMMENVANRLYAQIYLPRLEKIREKIELKNFKPMKLKRSTVKSATRTSVKGSIRKQPKSKKSSKRSARISALRNLPLSMRRSCDEGQVYRKRYARKSHVRKSGVRVKRSIVKGKCIKRASPQIKKSIMKKSVRKVKKF